MFDYNSIRSKLHNSWSLCCKSMKIKFSSFSKLLRSNQMRSSDARKRLEFTDVDEKFKLCSYPIPYSRNNYDTCHRVLDSCWKNYLVDNKRLARCESSARTIHNPSPCFCNKDVAGESRPVDIPWTLLQKRSFIG